MKWTPIHKCNQHSFKKRFASLYIYLFIYLCGFWSIFDLYFIFCFGCHSCIKATSLKMWHLSPNWSIGKTIELTQFHAAIAKQKQIHLIYLHEMWPLTKRSLTVYCIWFVVKFGSFGKVNTAFRCSRFFPNKKNFRFATAIINGIFLKLYSILYLFIFQKDKPHNRELTISKENAIQRGHSSMKFQFYTFP